MTLRLAFLTLGASLLACTAFGTDSADTADTATPTDTGSGAEDGVHQTQSCRDYLACVESATPDDYTKLNKKYGDEGSCWESTTDKMHECDAECEAGITDLEEEFGTTCESIDTGDTDTGGDTGDTDTGTSGVCPLDDGVWAFEFEYSDDGCNMSEMSSPWYGQVECNGGDMVVTLDNFGVPLPCTYDGRDFDCRLETEYVIVVAGTANSAGTSATGDFALEVGCYSAGYFSATKE